MVLAQVVSGWWLIFPLVIIGVGCACFALGKEVGKDAQHITDAFFDGFDEGQRFGVMRTLDALDEAPPMAEGLGASDE